MESARDDLKFVVRGLAKRPGLTAAIVGVLGLALGANTAVFSVVHSALFRVPVDAPDRVVVMWTQDLSRDRPLIEVSYLNFKDWKRGSETFEEMAAFGSINWGQAIASAGEPYQAASAAVSTAFFDVLRAAPLLGRTFVAEDDEPGAMPVAVLSYGLWQSRYGGDPDIVGERIFLEGETPGPTPFVVIGVMPRAFDFPRGAELWTPIRSRLVAAIRKSSPTADVNASLRRLNVLFVVGRLGEGVELAEARADIDGILAKLAQTYGWPPRTLASTPFMDFYLGGSTRTAMRALWGAVVLVVLIAGANAGGLLLMRTVERQQELAIRRALGASRWQLLRLVVLEAVVLSTLGGLVGVGLAAGGLRLVATAAPSDVPGLSEATLDGVVLLASALACVVVGLASAALPALSASAGLGTHGSGRAGDPEKTRSRRGFVAIQVGLATSLGIAAAAVGMSALRLWQEDLGYRPDRVLIASVPLRDSRYPSPERKIAFFEELLARLRSRPEIVEAGAVYLKPLSTGGVGADGGFVAEGQPFEPRTAEQNPMVNWQCVTPGAFAALGVDLVAGRSFRDADREDGLPVAIISEGLARHIWPNEPAIGKRIWATGDVRGEDREPVWRTVVGVARDVRYRELTWHHFDLYVPFRQSRSSVGHVVLRTAEDPLATAGLLRREVASIDPEQPIGSMAPLDELVARAFAPWRLSVTVLATFSIVALVLAACGLFSTLAYTVSRREPEVGVRMAVGATPRHVLLLFLKEGLALCAVGVALGTLVSSWTSAPLSHLLYEVGPRDLTPSVAVALLVLAVGLTATLVPARRAASLDPIRVLRHQ